MNRPEIRGGAGLLDSNLLQEKGQEELCKLKRNNMRLSRLVIVLAFLSLSLLGLLAIIMTIGPKSGKTTESGTASEIAAVADIPEIKKEDKWQIILVNRDNAVPPDFTVDLIAFGSALVDCRIADQLSDMTEAANKDGVMLTVCSGYRSVSQQREIYDSKKQSYLNLGYSEEASEINTCQYIQSPGASEHHTGLAVDLQTTGAVTLEENFADTPAYKWLDEHAEEYGFIERYPKEKSDITGVLWEPWHYRYVGVSNAKAIKTMGICLEEYVELVYN